MTGLVDALATARLARLVTTDTITRPLRDAAIMGTYALKLPGEDRDDMASYMRGRAVETTGDSRTSWAEVVAADPYAPKLATLVTCRWCTGVWVGLGVVAARRIAPRVWDPLARALALAEVAGLASYWDDQP